MTIEIVRYLNPPMLAVVRPCARRGRHSLRWDRMLGVKAGYLAEYDDYGVEVGLWRRVVAFQWSFENWRLILRLSGPGRARLLWQTRGDLLPRVLSFPVRPAGDSRSPRSEMNV